MNKYLELNKQLVQEVQLLRSRLQEMKSELIVTQKAYFDERVVNVSLQNDFCRTLNKLWAVCKDGSYAKVAQILRDCGFQHEDYSSDSSKECNSSRLSSSMKAKSLRRMSNVLQRSLPNASPTRNQCDDLDITTDTSVTEDTERNSESNESNGNDERSCFDHENISHPKPKEFVAMSNIYEEEKCADSSLTSNTSSETRNNGSQLGKKCNYINAPEINIKIDEKENKRPEVFGSVNQTSQRELPTRLVFVTQRRRKNISDPKETNLKVTSLSPTALRDLNSPICTPSKFSEYEINSSTPYSKILSSQRNDTEATTTAEEATTIKLETRTNTITGRPSRRCKPINLKEPGLIEKLRNDSDIKIHKNKRKGMRNSK